MKQNSDNEHDRITWTLGDLRAALREGNPDHGTELAFEGLRA